MPPISESCQNGRCDECTGYTQTINEPCACRRCHPPGGDAHDCSGRKCWCGNSQGGGA